MLFDHYAILEVSPRASEEVIDAAYRALVKLHHSNTKVMTAINAAYEVLSDPEERAKHDKKRNEKRKTIGAYRLIKEIAEGGFGKTYLGEHAVLGSKVCIKHANHVSPQDEKLLMEEAKLIWDLRHYSIPACRDILRMDDGSLALVMSYIPGPTLEELVEQEGGHLKPERAAWIIDRVINVLRYLHFNGVLHGDVKPQNIIIVEPLDTHQVAMVDYGLSLIRPKKDSSAKGYTPYFASPEQERGETLLPESDYYSLALTMIYALGGDIEHLKIPVDTPDPLCKFIKRLLVRDINGRPNPQKEDLHEAFRQVREKSFGRRHTFGA